MDFRRKLDNRTAETLSDILALRSSDDSIVDVTTERVRGLLDSLDPKRRRIALQHLRKESGKKIRELNARACRLEDEKEFLNRIRTVYIEFVAWVPDTPILERPGGSFSHHLRQNLLDGEALIFTTYSQANSVIHGTKEYETELFDVAQFFVVDHDWAAAFKNASDYADSSEFKLPAEVCAFEFKVSGRSVAMIVAEADGTHFYELMMRGKENWLSFGVACRLDESHSEKFHDGTPEPFAKISNFLRPQVKAICVALEAEVAESQVVRAPYKLNRAREKAGRAMLSDYHVVSLSRRTRGAPMLPASGEIKGARRLHFRRGHWRHFESFKTWVRWTLVGNPDLGFVDKEYRL